MVTHIYRSANDNYDTATLGENFEYLAGSRQGFTQKKNAWIWIKAMMNGYTGRLHYVQDNTGIRTKLFILERGIDGSFIKKLSDKKPWPKYKPKEKKIVYQANKI